MEMQRIIFTQDIRFHALAIDLQRKGEPFGGLIYGDQSGVGIGSFVRDLEIIAVASDLPEWMNITQRLPFK